MCLKTSAATHRPRIFWPFINTYVLYVLGLGLCQWWLLWGAWVVTVGGKVGKIWKGTPFLLPDDRCGGLWPSQKLPALTMKDFSLTQEMDQSGCWLWASTIAPNLSSACDWENLPVWLLRPGCVLATVKSGEGSCSSGLFLCAHGFSLLWGSLDLVWVYLPWEYFSLWFLMHILVNSGFPKEEERAAPSRNLWHLLKKVPLRWQYTF